MAMANWFSATLGHDVWRNWCLCIWKYAKFRAYGVKFERSDEILLTAEESDENIPSCF